MTAQKELLPLGFYDLFGEEAKNHRKIQNQLLDLFESKNYELIIPTMVEYEGEHKTNNNFKVLDPYSKQMLVIRNDITNQINRIAKNLNNKETNKICYSGDVYRMNIAENENNRKLTQAGIEYICKDETTANLEILSLALQTLDALKINDISVTIAIPDLFLALCKALKLSDNDQTELEIILINKDFSALSEKYPQLKSFIFPNGDKVNPEILNFFTGKDLQLITNITNLIENIKENHSTNIIFDPFDFEQYSYHTSFVFSITSHRTNKVIARGGRYKLNEKTSATGASFYIERLISNLQ